MGILVVHALPPYWIGVLVYSCPTESKQRNDDVGMFKAYAHGRRSFVLRGQNAWAGRPVFAFPPAWMDGDHEGIEFKRFPGFQNDQQEPTQDEVSAIANKLKYAILD